MQTADLTGGPLPERLPVVGGTAEAVSLRPGEGLTITLPKDQAQSVTREVLLPPFLYAPVKADQPVGRVLYRAGGETLFALPIYAGEAVSPLPPEPGFWEGLWGWITGWFAGELPEA